MDERTYVVALTGGIASGKTTVTRRFAALGTPVLDADQAARDVVVSGSDGFNAVVAAFGIDAMQADGSLDRAWLRALVFTDQEARRTLEEIVHPRINQSLHDGVAKLNTPYAILAIPLLVETWPQYQWTDRVLVVDVPEATQLQRLVNRDGIDQAMAEQMLQSQASRAQRLALADDILENSGPESALDAAVATLHQQYQTAARAM